MLQHVSESLSFWMLNNTPACTYTTFCLPIHLLMDLGLLPPFGYSELCCCEHGYIKYFSLPSGTYPEAGLLDHTIILIFFEELPYCYIKVSKDNKITQKWSVEETELKWHKVISLASLKLIINISFGLGFSFNSGYRVKMVLFSKCPRPMITVSVYWRMPVGAIVEEEAGLSRRSNWAAKQALMAVLPSLAGDSGTKIPCHIILCWAETAVYTPSLVTGCGLSRKEHDLELGDPLQLRWVLKPAAGATSPSLKQNLCGRSPCPP